MAERGRRVIPRDRVWTIAGLGAEGPFPEFKEKLELFGQFVGDSVIEEARMPLAHGVALQSKGEIHDNSKTWMLTEGMRVRRRSGVAPAPSVAG